MMGPLTLKLGKLPAAIDERTLRFENYLTPIIPSPPLVYNILKEMNVPVTDPSKLFPMDGNGPDPTLQPPRDVAGYGDCTIAGLGHAVTVYNALVSNLVIPSANDVVDLYLKLTKGEDSGLNELSVLKYWQQNGAFGEKPLAFVSVDSTNHTHVKQSIVLFGGCYLGIEVQDNFFSQFDANPRQPWDGSGSENVGGHAIFAVGYDAQYVTVLTWGSTQLITWNAWDVLVDEAYAILPSVAVNPGFSSLGLDLAQLQADLKVVQN